MKRIIDYQGKKIEGTIVSFDTIQENWNEYHLTDGTTLKLKTTVIEILRLDGEYNDDGDPIYYTKNTNMVTTPNIPDQLRKIL